MRLLQIGAMSCSATNSPLRMQPLQIGTMSCSATAVMCCCSSWHSAQRTTSNYGSSACACCGNKSGSLANNTHGVGTKNNMRTQLLQIGAMSCSATNSHLRMQPLQIGTMSCSAMAVMCCCPSWHSAQRTTSNYGSSACACCCNKSGSLASNIHGMGTKNNMWTRLLQIGAMSCSA